MYLDAAQIRAPLRRLRNAARHLRQKMASGLAFRLSVAEQLTPYVSASSNVPSGLIIESARSWPNQVVNLHRTCQELNWDGAYGAVRHGLDSLMVGDSDGEHAELASLFNAFGSDKTRNGYVPLYGRLLHELSAYVNTPRVLEIGLGTNDPKFLSTMGPHGVPGASVLAFRSFDSQLKVFGADLDASILHIPGVVTARVDQLAPDSFLTMVHELGESHFELIIDDGLHLTQANLNTLLFGLDHLAP